jgi:hypothetical protein
MASDERRLATNVSFSRQHERLPVSAASRIGSAFSAGAAAVLLAGCGQIIHLGDEPGDDTSGLDGAADSSSGADAPDGTKGKDGGHIADASGSVDGRATISWSASFETSDFSEWEGDSQGGSYSSAGGSSSPSTEQAHTGTGSAKLTINPRNGIVEDVYLFRGTSSSPPAEPEAYYGVWFFIPKPYVASFYWNIFHFLYGATQDRQGGVMNLWDLSLRSNTAGDLVPYAYDFIARQQHDEPVPIPVPVGKWFHIEILFRLAADPTGRVAVWQDGVLVLDVNDVVSAPTPWIQWSIGSASYDITSTPADLYIDDVTLSLSRVGP